MKTTLQCEDLLNYLSDYIDHNLDDELMQAARDHIATCNNCRVVLDSTQRTITLYQAHGQARQFPPERQQALYDRLLHAFVARKDE